MTQSTPTFVISAKSEIQNLEFPTVLRLAVFYKGEWEKRCI